MDKDKEELEWSFESSLAAKLHWHLRDKLGPEYEVSLPLGSPESNLRELKTKNLDEGWVLTTLLYTYPHLYPSHLPRLVKELRKHKKENVLYFVGAPRLSRESRAYLKEEKIPYIDLAGGFYLYLNLNQKEYCFDIDRDEYSEAKIWRVRGTSGLPGVSAGRVALYRTLLVGNDRIWGVRELAKSAGLDPGTTSRYLKESVNAGWVERRSRSEHALADPTALLDYWATITKRLRKHFVRRCRLPANDYSELRNKIQDYVMSHDDTYHTLWSGAEFYGNYQEQPIIGLYCDDIRTTMKQLGALHPYPSRSGNLWLLRTTDKALSAGATGMDNERAVCWQQVYVDLMNAPHRGKSIAAMLRKEMEQVIVR